MILELRVRNHPGVMSHITGLFARRAFNLDSILCTPVGDGTESRLLLQVADTPRLAQVERQLEKLHDVHSVRLRPDLTPRVFQTTTS
jgi:acetolactate synthase-1/3 small subunit